MVKSLVQIRKKIEQLQLEADAIQAKQAKEAQGVIGRIREAIAHYGLTPDDLFSNAGAKIGKRLRGSSDKTQGQPRAGKKVAIKYKDGSGNTWSGRGSQPRWLKAALSEGKKVEDFLV